MFSTYSTSPVGPAIFQGLLYWKHRFSAPVRTGHVMLCTNHPTTQLLKAPKIYFSLKLHVLCMSAGESGTISTHDRSERQRTAFQLSGSISCPCNLLKLIICISSLSGLKKGCTWLRKQYYCFIYKRPFLLCYVTHGHTVFPIVP